MCRRTHGWFRPSSRRLSAKDKIAFFSIHTQNNQHLNQTATAQSQRSRQTRTAGWFDPARQLTAKISMLNVSLGFCSSVCQRSSQSHSIVGVLYFPTFHRCIQKPENACDMFLLACVNKIFHSKQWCQLKHFSVELNLWNFPIWQLFIALAHVQ